MSTANKYLVVFHLSASLSALVVILSGSEEVIRSNLNNQSVEADETSFESPVITVMYTLYHVAGSLNTIFYNILKHNNCICRYKRDFAKQRKQLLLLCCCCVLPIFFVIDHF